MGNGGLVRRSTISFDEESASTSSHQQQQHHQQAQRKVVVDATETQGQSRLTIEVTWPGEENNNNHNNSQKKKSITSQVIMTITTMRCFLLIIVCIIVLQAMVGNVHFADELKAANMVDKGVQQFRMSSSKAFGSFYTYSKKNNNNNNKTFSSSTRKSTNKRTVLVTGGAGYIGSHTVVELLQAKESGSSGDGRTFAFDNIVVVDNLINSSEESLRRVKQLTKDSNGENRLFFRKCDIRDEVCLGKVLEEFPDITSCIHFAGLKAVGESVEMPLEYYNNNVHGTVMLLQMLEKYNVSNFVFSSSATVYGDPEVLPIRETAKLKATNPYGRTKLFIEEILRDAHKSREGFWDILLLRYFNPIGAHPSGIIGEDPRGVPNNVMPYISQVTVGRRHHLDIFGNDYNTTDGTGIRDYIHVVDLAQGHVAALKTLYQRNKNSTKGHCQAINLGTGHGVSVLELVDGMEIASHHKIPYQLTSRRPGDVAIVYADASLAKQVLGWEAKLNLTDMCTDAYRWQSMNPHGYNSNHSNNNNNGNETREDIGMQKQFGNNTNNN